MGFPASVYLPPADTVTFGLETFSAACFFRPLQQWNSEIPSHKGEKLQNTQTRHYASRHIKLPPCCNSQWRTTFLTFHRSPIYQITDLMLPSPVFDLSGYSYSASNLFQKLIPRLQIILHSITHAWEKTHISPLAPVNHLQRINKITQTGELPGMCALHWTDKMEKVRGEVSTVSTVSTVNNVSTSHSSLPFWHQQGKKILKQWIVFLTVAFYIYKLFSSDGKTQFGCKYISVNSVKDSSSASPTNSKSKDKKMNYRHVNKIIPDKFFIWRENIHAMKKKKWKAIRCSNSKSDFWQIV